MSTSTAALVPEPYAGDEALTKQSPPLDISSNVLKPSDQEPTTILVAVHSNTTIPEVTNTLVEPTEAFKTIASEKPKPFRFSFYLSTMISKPWFFS